MFCFFRVKESLCFFQSMFFAFTGNKRKLHPNNVKVEMEDRYQYESITFSRQLNREKQRYPSSKIAD